MRFLVFVFLVLGILNCSQQNSTENTENNPPVINAIIALPDSIEINESITIFCSAKDEDGDHLTYQWDSQTVGTIQTQASDSVITWIAPDYYCQPWIICTVSDPDGATASDSVRVYVLDPTP